MKAINLYKKSCEYKYSMGCSNLGMAYFKGDGVDTNFFEAAKYFEKGCELDDGFSCT